jgi:hypothetical protein
LVKLRYFAGCTVAEAVNTTANRNRAATVFNNGVADQLFDGTGLSWFFLDRPDDQINDGNGPSVTGDVVSVIH